MVKSLALPPKKAFSTMNGREAISLWWRERWVRIIVLLVAPWGIIDAVYTLLLWQRYGTHFEFNPIVRLALESDWHYVWAAVNAVSFFIFSMIVGSYYLHTRSKIYGTKVQWFVALIAVRIGFAVYNMLTYYVYWSPYLGAVLITVVVFILLSRLFARTDDISRKEIMYTLRFRIMRLEDYLLKRGVKTPTTQVSSTEGDTIHSVDTSDRLTTTSVGLRPRLVSVGYIFAALIAFLLMPFVLIAVGDLTGTTGWSQVFGPLVWWNVQSGTAFVISFFTVAFFVAVVVFLLLKAFTIQEEEWN